MAAASRQGGPVCDLCGLVNELVEAADERRLPGWWPAMATRLLCLDELGYVQLDARGAELMFRSDEREEKASVATAPTAFSEWGRSSVIPAGGALLTGSPSTPHHRDGTESSAALDRAAGRHAQS